MSRHHFFFKEMEMESRDWRGAENAISSYEQARSALRRSHRWINLVWKHWLKYSQKGNLFQKVPPRKIAMESLEVRNLMASLPYGAFEEDTGEFFLGRVAVTPVLLESNGAIDANTENWNSGHISQVLLNLQEGLQWWKDLLATKTSVHTLDFQIDTTFATTPVPSSYEGINRVSNDYALWVTEFLNGKGFNQSSSLEQNIRAFNQSQRVKHNADWSFTVFVVNSQNEQDGTFAAGGSFSRAFAFAGGLFFVTPSTRPASTYAHETGHMFWARDEYSGGGNYFQKRGYYNTQNLNAIDLNPVTNFQQATSIMSAGVVLENAYDQLVSPASTLAMLGWQDSDSDGVFDLLDVPMVLDGVGRFNSAASEYSFRGTAKTDTLPNLNSSGIQNDITLNRISRIEYRIDSGAWTTILTPNAYEVELDFKIPLSVSSGTLEIRAIDAKTSVTSNVFRGTIGAKADATTTSGIAGFVWTDANSNGIWDPNEKARPGMNLRLVDANGQPVALQRSVEPDDRGVGEISPNSFAGVSLAAVGNDTDGSVGVFADTRASTGNKVLRPYSNGLQDFATSWRGNRHQLRVDFQTPTSFVSVDVIGADLASYGRLEAYSSAGVLLDRVTSAVLSNGRVQNLAIGRATADIAYIMIKGHDETGIVIDNIKFGPQSSTKTDALGRYSFPSLVAGTYQVEMVLPAQGYTPTSPATSKQSAVVVASQATPHVDFGVFYSGSPWNNELFPEDTNKDGVVTPLDALLVINQLNLSGSQSLDGSSITTPPFLDVTNDRILTPLDALFVINYLNLNGIGGEGEAKQFAEGPEEASGGARLISPDGEGSILPVWNRYADEVGPLLSNKEFQEKLMEPQWTLPEPCNCPYCDSFR